MYKIFFNFEIKIKIVKVPKYFDVFIMSLLGFGWHFIGETSQGEGCGTIDPPSHSAYNR